MSILLLINIGSWNELVITNGTFPTKSEGKFIHSKCKIGNVKKANYTTGNVTKIKEDNCMLSYAFSVRHRNQISF